MQVCHNVSVVFDEPNLVSCAGLVPALALAKSAGLHDLAGEYVQVPGSAGANPQIKVPTLVAGMTAGADSISDMGLLRHGGMDRLFTQGRAPTTLGTHLRSYWLADVRRLDAVASRFLAGLAGRVPKLVSGAAQHAYLDIDDTVLPTYGRAKQGAAMGYSMVEGLNAQVAILSTATASPVIVAIRLRKGNASSGDGSAWFFQNAIAAARAAGATGPITMRADSAYYRQDLICAATRAGITYSVTAKRDAGVTAAITRIPEDAWTPIKYPKAIWDAEQSRWISDAQVAQIDYTAFTSYPRGQQVRGRLVVRRVKRLNPACVPEGQDELFTTWRHHAIFTNSGLSTVEVDQVHRDHAVVEQAIADLKAGPLAHMPSGKYTANAAWTVLAAMAYNLTRALAVLASDKHARARGATIRAELINVPARIAFSARRHTLHLPRNWTWRNQFQAAFTATCGPPAAA